MHGFTVLDAEEGGAALISFAVASKPSKHEWMRAALAAVDEATELQIDSLLVYGGNVGGAKTKMDKLKKGVQSARQVAKGVGMRVADKSKGMRQKAGHAAGRVADKLGRRKGAGGDDDADPGGGSGGGGEGSGGGGGDSGTGGQSVLASVEELHTNFGAALAEDSNDGDASFSRAEPVQVVDEVHWDKETGRPFTIDADESKTVKDNT